MHGYSLGLRAISWVLGDGRSRQRRGSALPVAEAPALMEPVRPANVDPYARAFLARLQERPEADRFVLGGYFALQHYLDYRDTHDVDAWWRGRRDMGALAAARETFAQTALEFGYAVRERSWGETVSLEALSDGTKVFSFQIAVRTIELAEGRLAVHQHLAGLAARLPIERIPEERRAAAVALREWFRDTFAAAAKPSAGS